VKRLVLPGFVFLLVAGPLPSQEPTLSNGEVARETSDPTSLLWYLYTETAMSFRPGTPYRTTNQTTLEVQPSLPLLLTSDWKMLNFPDLTLSTQGTPGGTQIQGLAGLTWLATLGPAAPVNGFSWGLGPYTSFPVATTTGLDAPQWQFGGGAVISWRTPNTVVSAIVKTGWTATGPGDEAGAMEIQYTAQYFFGDGWQVGLGRPRITYTWDESGTGRWDIPVGLDMAKTFRIGQLPVKIMLEYDFFVLSDNRWEPTHLFRLTILPVLNSPFDRPLF
jgi:hypothetical protein